MTDSNVIARHQPGLPLCVDLDETLCPVDTLGEVIVRALRWHPIQLLRVVLGFLGHRNRSRFKAGLSAIQPFNAENLPIRPEVRAFILEARAAGRPVFLATGADEKIARAVAEVNPLFDGVFASGGGVNLKSRNKAARLSAEFGDYEYLGDCGADISVWRAAKVARVVAPGGKISGRLIRAVPDLQALPVAASPGWASLGILRPHQWAKNLLLLVPVFTSHRWFEGSALSAAVLGMAATSLLASAIYILNDILDAEDDRKHPDKRNRLIAAGAVGILQALGIALAAVGGAIAISILWLPPAFGSALLIYGLSALIYIWWFKRVPGLDLLMLTGFYVLRLVLGGAATGIECSGWLLLLAAAFFGSLAALKRYAELRVWKKMGASSIPGRAYSVRLIRGLWSFGMLCAAVAVAVFPFYVQSQVARELYQSPGVLLAFIPLLLIGFFRVWHQAWLGRMPHDPVMFALKDPASYVIGALGLLTVYLSMRGI